MNTETGEGIDPEHLTGLVQGRLDKSLHRLGRDLVNTLLRRFPDGCLPGTDVDTTADIIARGARALTGRSPGALALEVANPRDPALGTVIDVTVDDAPFLLSTIDSELHHRGLSVSCRLYPVFGVRRDREGRIHALSPARARGATERQTWIHVRLGQRLGDAELADLERSLGAVLGDALHATRDFPALQTRAAQVVESLRSTAEQRYTPGEVKEAIALVRWLLDDHLVFLGARDYVLTPGPRPSVQVVPGSGLGVLHDTATSQLARPVAVGELPPARHDELVDGPLLTVSLTSQLSTVHRREPMVHFTAKLVDADGAIIGAQRIVGLFTRKTAAEPASAIPILRRKLRAILDVEDVVDHSYDERAMRTLFESLPLGELFTAATADLRRVLTALVHSDQPRLRVFCRVDPTSAIVSALVALPRQRFNTTLRAGVDRLVNQRFPVDQLDSSVSFAEGYALLSSIGHLNPETSDLDVGAAEQGLEREIADLVRSWVDDVRFVLRTRLGVEGESLGDRWLSRLPAGYGDTVPPDEAVGDLLELEALVAGDERVRMRVVESRRKRADAGDRGVSLRFKLYRRGPAVELSSFVPILESLGFVAVESMPHVIRPFEPGGPVVRIHDYGIRAYPEDGFAPEDDGPRVADAAYAMWAGLAEADSLNRLVLLAGLHWRDVAVLRAYRRYQRHVGTAFTESYQNSALCEYPEIARALAEYFAARFRPDVPDPDEHMEDARGWLLHLLRGVARLDQDRILRGYLGMIDATLRTNRYRPQARSWLALKFDSARVPGLPRPEPYREIFVYSPSFEGIHLRGGPVARGGIRWSDRLEDFRDEVLDLMKAQMVKNAVIVPTGSKGGFVLKRPVPADRRDREVRQRYEQFIRALLDVTDNVIEGQVQAPEGVRRHDGDDPYLVVAADRGTASYSDLANAISEEYGFWLGDGFASGGSHGYDHKAMGITARGAWVAVQRHFRELGIDVQRSPITVVGIGDMSGDVFGNAMLRSRSIKLVGAFDHRDVFLDPDPDPAVAYEERRRLFNLPQSSWQDYDRTLISPGGGVWSRTVKEIPVSPEGRRLLRLEDELVSPPELIQALLRAPVDLLFAGGIGTFVKASSQRHAEVGDRSNDTIRVDADQVGARVIGEGGNLAVTQRGRIQYARRGGRINLDAIDNVAGVDTSDREVNLKILLRQAVAAGQLQPEERPGILAEVSDDIVRRVLRDVELQTWTLSQEVADSPGGIDSYEQLMQDLEAAGRLDRDVEALPSSDEIDRRREAGAGLTRPELGLLLAYAKTDIADRLIASDLPDEPVLQPLLEQYFPSAVVDRFGHLLIRHRLRRELIATLLANDLVNRMGINYLNRTVHELGCPAHVLAGAYWTARQVTDAEADWRQIEELGAVLEPALQLELKRHVDRLVDACTRVYAWRRPADDLEKTIRRDRDAIAALEERWRILPSAEQAAKRRDLLARVADQAVDPELVRRLVMRPDLAYVPDAALIADERDLAVEQVAAAFAEIGRALPLDRIQDVLERLEPEERWQRWEQRSLVDELRALRRLGAVRALDAFPGDSGDGAVRRLLAQRSERLERVWSLLGMVGEQNATGLAPAAVLMSSLRAVFD